MSIHLRLRSLLATFPSFFNFITSQSLFVILEIIFDYPKMKTKQSPVCEYTALTLSDHLLVLHLNQVKALTEEQNKEQNKEESPETPMEEVDRWLKEGRILALRVRRELASNFQSH